MDASYSRQIAREAAARAAARDYRANNYSALSVDMVAHCQELGVTADDVIEEVHRQRDGGDPVETLLATL